MQRDLLWQKKKKEKKNQNNPRNASYFCPVFTDNKTICSC